VHKTIVGLFVCCEIPKAKNPADLSSTILKQLNFLLDAKLTASGIFLDPGDITTFVIPNSRHVSITVCADGIFGYII
jgi:hypothetical protein